MNSDIRNAITRTTIGHEDPSRVTANPAAMTATWLICGGCTNGSGVDIFMLVSVIIIDVSDI